MVLFFTDGFHFVHIVFRNDRVEQGVQIIQQIDDLYEKNIIKIYIYIFIFFEIFTCKGEHFAAMLVNETTSYMVEKHKFLAILIVMTKKQKLGMMRMLALNGL